MSLSNHKDDERLDKTEIMFLSRCMEINSLFTKHIYPPFRRHLKLVMKYKLLTNVPHL